MTRPRRNLARCVRIFVSGEAITDDTIRHDEICGHFVNCNKGNPVAFSNMKESAVTDELREELERQRGTKMTFQELEAQKISFVYGNAPQADKGTKASVKKSLELAELA